MSAHVALAMFVVVAVSACGGESRSQPSLDRELMAAARNGDAAAVRSLLDRGAPVDARDRNGATALVAAAYGNHLDIARQLVDAGADVNAKDETEQSAYLIATSEVGDDPRLLELTLKSGADVEVADGNGVTPLAHARRSGFDQIAAILEPAGAGG